MTNTYTEPTPAAIYNMLGKFKERLSRERVDDVVDWLDHREWELALDQLADSLFDANIRLSDSEMLEVREILSRMSMPKDKYAFLRLK